MKLESGESFYLDLGIRGRKNFDRDRGGGKFSGKVLQI